YAAGHFTNIGFWPRKNLAALDAATGIATAWDPSPNYDVGALISTATKIYVGGQFTQVGGGTRFGLAGLDPVTGTPDVILTAGLIGGVSALSLNGNTLYAAGNFGTFMGQARDNLGAVDITTGAALAWNPRANGAALAVAPSGSSVFVGGQFTSIGASRRNDLA